MKAYVLDFFKYNDWANQKLLEIIKQLPDKEESVKLFSHMIHAQDKWYNRIVKHVDDSSIAWMSPIFMEEELLQKWNSSINQWIELIGTKTESDLQEDIVFKRASDGKDMCVKLIDLTMQLNYHAIHHRAQINTLISKQGLTPPPTDYIYTKLKEL